MATVPWAIVLDGNQRSALATTRSLGRRGVPVMVAESEARPLAAASRYCLRTLSCPDPAASPDAYINWLTQIDTQHPGSVIIPMTDLTTPLLLKSRPALNQLSMCLPDAATYEAASDKFRLFELAKQAGVRVPQTALITRAGLRNLDIAAFRYPVVIKPRASAMQLDAGMMKRGVEYVLFPSELVSACNRSLVDDSDQLLLQEYIEGYGAGVFALYESGLPRFYFAHRRIRERPPSGGVSVLSESAPLPEEGVEAATRLLDALNWHGVAMVEFKVDSAGAWWLIEINARLWGSLQLAVDSGADFPWFLYQQAIQQGEAPEQRYEIGCRLRWWLGDLDNLYLQLRSKAGFGKKISALANFAVPWLPGLRYEFLRLDDPAPSIVAFRQYLEALVGRRKSI